MWRYTVAELCVKRAIKIKMGMRKRGHKSDGA